MVSITSRYIDGELTLTIRGGDKCHTNFHRTTVISFTCNQTAGKWIFSDYILFLLLVIEQQVIFWNNSIVQEFKKII